MYNIYGLVILPKYIDTVGGRQEKHQAKLSDEVIAQLSVYREVQVICIWYRQCHPHPIISCFIKIQIGLTFLVPAYAGYPWKEDVKRVSVCVTFY